MRNIPILCDYEAVLLGNLTNYRLSNKNNPDDAVPNARYLLKYIFRYIFRWDPFEVRDYLNKDLVRRYKLGNCIKNIPFPPELDKDDYSYVASWLYPKVVPYKKETVVLEKYERVLRNKDKLPSGFFLDQSGHENLMICLRYVLSIYFIGQTSNDIYEFFSKSKNASAFMAKYKLSSHWRKFYNLPIEAVHNALPEDDRSEFMYRYCIFMSSYSKRPKARKK